MDAAHDDLWQRLSTYTVDDDTARLSFLDRLVRENRWDRSHTDRVFAEYRRFVFLAMTTDHQVTPSEDVDQVWHLHLTYTHSYWDDLCGEVLGRPLHHQPTVGGVQQGAHWNDTYTRTLDSYRTAFGEAPPSDIWPAAADRFADAGALRWVDTARYWTVPKRPVQRSRRALAGVGAVLAVLVAIAGAAAAQTEPESTGNLIGVAIFVVLAVVFVAIFRGRGRKRRRDGDSGCGGSGCGGSGCGD